LIRQSGPRFDALPVSRKAQLLGVHRSLLYRKRADRSAHVAQDNEIEVRLQELAIEFSGGGYRMLTGHLGRLDPDSPPINSKRVRRIMRKAGLFKRRKRHWVKTTDSEHGLKVFPNLLKNTRPTGLDQVWVADITYIRLPGGFCYLAAILDAYSRRVIGWHLSSQIDGALATMALDKALETRKPAQGLIHHSDRGVQYACKDYVQRLEAAGAKQSMSAKGAPRENAQAESFFRTLKTEEVNLQDYQNLADARASLARFIEDVYNRKRLHSALKYVPPAEFEAQVKATRPSTSPGIGV
jgi:putative transposase